MNKDMPHAYDLCPWDVRPLIAQFFGKRVRCFTDDLKMPYKPILDKLIARKGLSATRGIAFDIRYGL
jgi:hypothetical protein